MSPAPVSVVIPAYNVAGCIRTCLDSVLGQTLPAREVIVVDDGSTDRTYDIVRDYSRLSVRCLAQANAGPAAARNRGLEAATQPFVAFLDADDYWLPDFVRRTVAFMDRHPAAIAVSTGLQVRDAHGRLTLGTAELQARYGDRDGVLLPDFLETWASYDHVRTGSSLFRRPVVQAAGGFREDLRSAEDLELWGYLGTQGPWGFIGEALWVGNPTASGALNWRQKYRERGRHCTEIEVWERRIVSRLRASDQRVFARVRGRVAASYTYARILAGDSIGARRIAVQHLREMPPSRVRSLLRSGLYFGDLGWTVATATIGFWEDVKSLRLRLGAAGRAAARNGGSPSRAPQATTGK